MNKTSSELEKLKVANAELRLKLSRLQESKRVVQVDADHDGRNELEKQLKKELNELKSELRGTQILFERYRTAFNCSRDGLWYFDGKTKKSWFSERWCEMHGFDDESRPHEFVELAGMVHPDDREAAWAVFKNHHKKTCGNFPYEVEFRVQHPKYGDRWIRARGNAERDNDGNLVYWAGSHTDITELKDQQNFYERILDAVPSLIFLKDFDLKFNWVNQATATALGRSKLGIIGLTDGDVLPNPDEASRFVGGDREVLETGEELRIRVESLSNLDGHVFQLATTKVPFNPSRLADDLRMNVLGVATDITDLSIELQHVIDEMPQCVFMKDSDGNYTRVNRAFLAFHNHKHAKEVLGFGDKLHSKDPNVFTRIIEDDRRVLDIGERLIQYTESFVKFDDSHVTLLTTKVPIRQADGTIIGLLGFHQDITKNEDELSRKIVSQISHSFVEKGLILIRHLTELQNHPDDARAILPHLQAVAGAIQCSAARAKNITASSKVSDKKWVNIETAVANISRMWGDSRIEVEEYDGPDLIVKVTDGVSNAIEELIANALHHSPECTQIKVWLEGRETECEIHVWNDKADIPAWLRKDRKMFDLFACGAGGVGLGLYHVDGVARLHDGSIDEVGGEDIAHFILKIPLARLKDDEEC